MLKCTDFLDKLRAYEFKVKEKFGDDIEAAKKHLKAKPFCPEKARACPFHASAHRPGHLLSRKKADGTKVTVARVSKKSWWGHSATCTSVGKADARQILSIPQFQVEVRQSAFKAASKKMLTTVQTHNQLGGETVSNNTLYRAQRSMAAIEESLHEEKFEALPSYMRNLAAANDGSLIVCHHNKILILSNSL